MKNNKLKARLAALAAAGIVILSSHSSSPSLTALKTTDKAPADVKPYHQIIKDSEHFNANMDIVYRAENCFDSGEGYLRMKMTEDYPVVIQCAQNIEDRELKLIESAVNYLNKLFATINNNYQFQILKSGESVTKYSSLICIKNQEQLELEGEDVLGQAITHSDLQDNRGGSLIYYAEVHLDWPQIKDKTDAEIYYVILHELAHTLGIDDVYFQGALKRTSTINKETFMNTSNKNILYFYPNDYAILQVLYSDEYTKHDNYLEAVDAVNKKIEKYTKSFYQKYAETLKEKTNATDALSEEPMKQNITWCSIFTKNENTYNLKLNKDHTCTLSIYDKAGNLIEQCNGNLIFIDGILFATNINIKKASNYDNRYSDELSLKLTLSFYIDKQGTLTLNDGDYKIAAIYPTFEEKAPFSKSNAK